VGGILSGADAVKKIRAGASLIQIYTGLIYRGPKLIGEIKREICRELRETHLSEFHRLVGIDARNLADQASQRLRRL
jgi:dihydroorotate dehydrogenase